MPDFELSGPDGARYQLTAPDEAAALAAFSTLHGTKTAEEPVSATNLARSAARGVPIVGGLVNKAEAATEAALAPIVEPFMEQGPNTLTTEKGFGGRYRKALRLQEAKDTGFDVAHPVASTAAKIAGGVGSLGGVMARVPGAAAALGAEGTMAQMVGRGAASGAALSAADAAVRGENPIQAAEEGAVLGAAGGPVGKAIGKTAGAVMGAFRPKAPPVHVNTTNVAGVDVPVPTADPVAAGKIEIARRGGAGEPAQRLVQQGDEATQTALEQARTKIGSGMDVADAPAPAALDTAEGVAAELRNMEQKRFQTEQNVMQRAQAGTEELRRQIGVNVDPNTGRRVAVTDPRTGAPAVLADSPGAAAEQVGQAVTAARDKAVATTRGLYKEAYAVPGEFEPSVPATMSDTIRARLNTGEDPLWVDPTTTSKANEALRLIDQTLGGGKGLLENKAAVRPAAAAAEAMGAAPQTEAAAAAARLAEMGVPPERAQQMVARLPGATAERTAPAAEAVAAAAPEVPPSVGMREMDQARKRLVTMFSDAKSAALRSGERTDMRAMGKILDEFDQVLIKAFDEGRFSGDSADARRLIEEARASHAAYRQTFSSRGPGDEIGRAVEKILGRYTDTRATPDEIAKLSYGSLAEPGGAQAVKVAQRLRGILGPTSPEWGAYKQGLLSHLVDTPPGTAPRTMTETADRIDQFLNGTKGRPLAHAVLSADERAALANHAEALRVAEPVPLSKLDSVEKVVARISGRDGSLPASATEVADYLFGRTGAGDKGISVRLAQRLKRDLSPEGWTRLRQGMWSKLTGEVEGKTPFGAQKLSQRLHEFLNGNGKPLSQVLYTQAERAEMAKFAAAVKAHAPIPGTTNPSGTAPMLAKMAGKASHLALPLFGAAHGGIVGAIAGVALDRGLTSATNARAARQIGRLYYGPQPNAVAPVDPAFAKAGVLLGRGVQQGQVGSR